MKLFCKVANVDGTDASPCLYIDKVIIIYRFIIEKIYSNHSHYCLVKSTALDYPLGILSHGLTHIKKYKRGRRAL